LRAVSSRQLATAQTFVAERPGVEAVQGLEALLSRADIDAIYLAIPTMAKEATALAAIAAGKHVLVEKPFVDQASVRRMSEAAAAQGVLFMDATHFIHHPRTAAIQSAISEKIGTPRSLHTTFYFPFSDRANIRFDPAQEPMTALGDMAWYSMRAVVEYLRPSGRIASVVTVPERDPQTNAIVQASGLIAFESGETSTFDIGYTAGTALMDLQLLGTSGVIEMDDFVLDWESSWAFKNPADPAGYFHRTGMATRHEVTFIATPADTPAEVSMVENFAALASSDEPGRSAFAAASLKTQKYLDALWRAASS
jgi:predicted dehydrogenase